MTTRKEREEFVAVLARAFPNKPAARYAQLLMRHAATHGCLAVESCNGHPAQGSPTMDARELGKLQQAWDERIEKREAQIERRISALCMELGITADFGGDPRGYTVKLHLPDGSHNTLGGKESGYGVPQ